MKKLTAGIFATLLTVVGVSAANADIASKAYVDGGLGKKADASTVSTLQGTVTEQGTTIAGHTSSISTINTTLGQKANSADVYTITAADGKFATQDSVTSGLNAKQNNLATGEGGNVTVSGNGNVITGVTATGGKVTFTTGTVATAEGLSDLTERVTTAEGEIDTLQAADTTLDNRITANEGAITTLNGADTVENSVAYKIKNALTPYSTTQQMNTAIAEATDDMATNASVTTALAPYAKTADVAGTYATQTALTEGLATKQGTLKAGTNITIAADGTIDTKNIATSAALTTLEGKVTANTTAIEGMDLTEVTGVIKSISQADGKVTATAGTISNADVAANAAIDASKIAGLSALARATIPTECETGASECVLKLKDGAFAWETIALTYGE